jgi:hypothetical protein
MKFSPSGSPLVSGHRELTPKPATEPNRTGVLDFTIDESALESLLQEVSYGVQDYKAMTLGAKGQTPAPADPPIPSLPSGTIPVSTATNPILSATTPVPSAMNLVRPLPEERDSTVQDSQRVSELVQKREDPSVQVTPTDRG